MTTHEAAALLDITPRSVARLVRLNLITATWNDYARRFEFDAAEIERYQRERRAVGKPRKLSTEGG